MPPAFRLLSPHDDTSRVEVLGGALVSFTDGVAVLDGPPRRPVTHAARARGYRVELVLERPATAGPPPEAPPEPSPPPADATPPPAAHDASPAAPPGAL